MQSNQSTFSWYVLSCRHSLVPLFDFCCCGLLSLQTKNQEQYSLASLQNLEYPDACYTSSSGVSSTFKLRNNFKCHFRNRRLHLASFRNLETFSYCTSSTWGIQFQIKEQLNYLQMPLLKQKKIHCCSSFCKCQGYNWYLLSPLSAPTRSICFWGDLLICCGSKFCHIAK